MPTHTPRRKARYAALGGYDAETRLKNIVQGFKLNDLLERPYNVLSGGQKTVVNLAAVVLREPDILLLDEPTNHLDMQTLDWFEGFLAKYRGTVLMGLARPPVFRPCGNAHAHFRGRHLHSYPAATRLRKRNRNARCSSNSSSTKTSKSRLKQ